MKTIGLIGGLCWESSSEYYRILNQTVRERLGGTHSAKCILVSVDLADIVELQMANKWDESGSILADAARKLEAAGADCVLLCTNTMHKVAHHIKAAISVPFLHIADATAAAIKDAGLHTVGLLGTDFTMSQEFYKGRLSEKHGLTVLVPNNEEDKQAINGVIYKELVYGQLKDESKQIYLEIIQKMVNAGAQGVILGCTEIGLLIHQEDCPVPVFDTARIHALAAVDFALKPELEEKPEKF